LLPRLALDGLPAQPLDHEALKIDDIVATAVCRWGQEREELPIFIKSGRICAQKCLERIDADGMTGRRTARNDVRRLARRLLHTGTQRLRIDWPVLAQSALKAARPLSVSACFTSSRRMAGGIVATWAPMSAASLT